MRMRVGRTGVGSGAGAGQVPAERELARRWAALVGPVTTTDGDGLDVVYPGRPNPGPGPDFVDAVLATPQGTVRGAVELHRRTGDWERHGHSADPSYGGVVLHVVGHDDGRPGCLPGGQQLPLVELGATGAGPGALPAFPCRVARETGADLTAALRQAGEERFERAVAAMVEHLRGTAPSGPTPEAREQVLYEQAAVALGYSRNSEAMGDLARALPLAEAMAAGEGCSDTVRQPVAEAVFLGTAGLLPSQRHLPAARRRDAYAETLERHWSESGRRAALRAYRWDAARSRPENSAVRRVVALAHLILRWPCADGRVGCGFAESLQVALRDDPAAANRRLAALAALPAAEGYWRDHWDFGVPARGAGEAAALIGPSRAADVVVNVFLPLAAAMGAVDGRADANESARGAYSVHPALAENWITRLVRDRAGLLARPAAADPVRTAVEQQGLIAVYEATCHALRCAECALR